MAIMINLLPWRDKIRKDSQREFFILFISAFFFTLLLLTLLHLFIDNRIEYQQTRVNYLENKVLILNQQMQLLKQLQIQKEQLLHKRKSIQEIQRNQIVVIHLFNELAKVIPEGVFLTKVQRISKNILLEGYAQTNTQVSNFMRNLETSIGYAHPILEEIKATQLPFSYHSHFLLHVLQK